MNLDFGDILDARGSPQIGHFIIMVGESAKKGQPDHVLYYMVTSRVYAVFKGILSYFNDCLSRKDRNFLKFYPKEKGKVIINSHGLLSEAVFLDSDTSYSTCLDVESMVVVNRDPSIIEKNVLETLHNDGKIFFVSKLTKLDAINLIHAIRHSNGVSPFRRQQMATSFNKN